MIADEDFFDAVGKHLTLLRAEPGDILVVRGVELPHDPETGELDGRFVKQAHEYFGLRVLWLVNPDASASLEQED